MLSRCHGVTLIELMIGMIIISSLLMVGMPSFTHWIQDLQVRGAAESIQSGLLLARSEAIRRNRPVQLTLADAGGLVEWRIGCVSVESACPVSITERKRGEGGLNTRMAVSSVPSAGNASAGTALAAGAGLPVSIAFNGLGQLAGPAPGRVEVSHVRLGSARRLEVRIDAGMVRICKPQSECA
nr:GspH/FimT family pseudopilin [uncultured Noviherbaspirillum sp.]